ncbi:MAG: DUF4398 domain-containing protein [Steroidobacteraceae bacterium]
MLSSRTLIRGLRPVTAVALLAAISCAGTPEPRVDLAAPRSLVAEAERGGAQQYDSIDLETARSELRQAEQNAKDKPVLADRQSQEATVDAQLALARTRSAKAEQALREVNSGTATLESESERQQDNDGSGPQPAALPQPAQWE